MKLYTPPPPPDVLRVSIRRQGEKTLHFTFCDADPEQCRETLQKVIQDAAPDIFSAGRVTAVEVREYKDGKNGRTISFSFRGLNVADTYATIKKHFSE